MVAYSVENTGLLDFIALKDHYEGVGVNTVSVMQADKVLKRFFLFR